MPDLLQREIQELRSLFWSDRDPEGRAFAPLADALRRAGEFEPAVDLLSEGLERLPDFASGHVVAGGVHRARGAAGEAEAAFRRALELDGENVAALRGLGFLLNESGRSSEALSMFRRLEAMEPGDPEVRASVIEIEGAADVEPLPVETLAPEVEAVVPIESLAPDEPVPIEDLAPDGNGLASAGSAIGPGTEDGEEDVPASEGEVGATHPLPAPPAAGDHSRAPRTRTMAEVYASQGLPDKAVDIYERLVEEAPDDEELRTRLDELRGLARPAGGSRTSEARSTPGMADEELESLAGSMNAAGDDSPETISPFNWTEERERERGDRRGVDEP